MSNILKICLLCLPITLAACGEREEAPRKKAATQGRAETQGLRNVEVLGQSGAGPANRVDAALDANDQRKAELDAALDAQTNPQ